MHLHYRSVVGQFECGLPTRNGNSQGVRAGTAAFDPKRTFVIGVVRNRSLAPTNQQENPAVGAYPTTVEGTGDLLLADIC